MPTYVRLCKSGHSFTTVCAIDDRDRPVDCPECGQATQRKLTPSAISHNRKIIFAGDAGFPLDGADYQYGDKRWMV